MAVQRLGYMGDQRGIDQGFVALDVHHDLRVVEFERVAGFGQAVGAGRMVGTGHQAVEAVGADGIADGGVVRGHEDAGGAAGLGLPGDADDHGDAADVRQHLAGQARGGGAGRDDGGEIGRVRHEASRRQGSGFVLPRLGLGLEHDRNAVADGEAQAVGAAAQEARGAVVA